MKTILNVARLFFTFLGITIFSLFIKTNAFGQVCSNPASIIYGLTGNGAIYPINVSNASNGTVVKNNSYSGTGASRANGLAYNSTNGKFYYFKRNISSSQEFVSYDPALGIVTPLAASTCTNDIHTGCITANGLYYYTIDVNANMHCYNIVTNTWTFICSIFTDQNANSVSDVIKTQNAGDIAFDGNGNLWIVTSDNSNYGVYSIQGPLPTTTVSNLVAHRRVDPSTPTPTGKSIAGIAFNPSGQIFMATKSDNRLYRLENTLSMTYLGTFSVSDLGNDLTSCAFPTAILPVTWVSFTATLKKENNVELKWETGEKNNTGFTIEHSADGIQWRTVGALSIENHETVTQEYYFNHKDPIAGKNYYRIKTLNETGKVAYSEIKFVIVKTNTKLFEVWPNPAQNSINISGNLSSAISIKVFDLAGRLTIEKQLSPGETTINISAIKTGIYILSIYSPDRIKQNQKFIKN